MVSKELRLMVEAASNEKGIDPETIYEALEMAIATAIKKQSNGEMNVRVEIDRQSGEYLAYRYWEVIPDNDIRWADEPQDGAWYLLIEDAQKQNPDIQEGEFIEHLLQDITTARISAQTAKHVILQKFREAERAQVIRAFQSNRGKLLAGTVKRVTRDAIFIDLGRNAEGILPREEMIPREVLRVGDRVRAFLYEINSENKGPQFYLSRVRPEMLIELFKIEVPEIGEEVIQIKTAARDPGSRAKIAVKTNDGRIDPVGACVGMRGARVQAVSSELCGERIDIVLWDDNPAQMVIHAMSPAEVTSIVMDEDKHTIDVLVPEEQLSQAIGRNGQNVRLASQLTGWTLNVMTETQAEEKNLNDAKETIALFIQHLGVDEEVALVLVQEGFSRLEEIAYVPEDELLNIEGFDEETIKELQSRARNALLTSAIVSEEHLNEVEPAEDLLSLPGMTRDLAYTLARCGIITREDLAEQATDDLEHIQQLETEQAAQLIMAARAHWFAGETE